MCDRAVCDQPSFSRDTTHLQRHCQCETRCCGLEPSLAPYVLGSRAIRQQRNINREVIEKEHCARTTETACNAQSKEGETNCVISQETDRS